MMSLLPINPDNPVLVIVVKRENIVDNTLNQIMKCGPCDLKKPLKVQILLDSVHLFPAIHLGRIQFLTKLLLIGSLIAFLLSPP